jgi:hypothetical protein
MTEHNKLQWIHRQRRFREVERERHNDILASNLLQETTHFDRLSDGSGVAFRKFVANSKALDLT